MSNNGQTDANEKLYGIWVEGEVNSWMVLVDGTVFHTPYIKAAFAQLSVATGDWGPTRPCRVAEIGPDGSPVSEYNGQ